MDGRKVGGGWESIEREGGKDGILRGDEEGRVWRMERGGGKMERQ